MAESNFNRTHGALAQFDSSNLGLLASTLLDPSSSANTKLIDAYVQKIRKEAEEINKKSISTASKVKQIQEAAQQTIHKLVEKEIANRKKLLQDEEDLEKKSVLERAQYVREQEKLLEKQAKQNQAEKDAVADQLKKIEETLTTSKNLSEIERNAFTKEKDELLKKQAELAEKDAENLAETERINRLKLKDEEKFNKTQRLLDAKEKADQRKKDKETAKEIKELEREVAQDQYEHGEMNLGSFLKSGTDFSALTSKAAWTLNAVKAGIDAIHKLGDTFDNAFKQAEDTLNTYQAKISTRLEGSGREYKDITKMLSNNLALSSIVDQKRVLENVGKLVESGIAYDLEQRAFLATIAEDISSTFDAFDSNLLRIIRLQREDSTYARMGLETALSRMFNEYFLDSSYLNTLYDSVSSAIVDSTAQLNAKQSAEFEYTVQKWLGSLYSMGVSDSFISQIASGLNMLGSGNVQGLSGSPMQTLFAMAANRSGMDYASLLTGGLNSTNTNTLLKAMVQYLAEIADSTNKNKVVAGAYSNLFGMSLADMRAIGNLAGDVNNIFSETLSYEEMAGTTTQRVTTLGSNYSIGKRVQTLFNNFLFTTAQTLTENTAKYLIYKTVDIVGKIGDEILPTVSILGTSINLGGTLTDIIKSGIFGVSMIGPLVRGIQHLNEGNELYNWTTQGEMRGTGYNLTSRSSISQSYTAGGSSADIEYQTLSNASKSAKEKAGTINGQGEEEEEITISTLYYGLFNNTNKEGALSAMNSNITNISTLLTSSFVADLNAQRVVITGFNLDNNSTLLEFPVKFGAMGTEQMRAFTSNLSTSIKGADEATLYMLLNVILSILAENGALNVNLESSSLPLTDLVTGKGTPTAEKQPPSGNNISVPHTTARNTASRSASVLDYNVSTYY